MTQDMLGLVQEKQAKGRFYLIIYSNFFEIKPFPVGDHRKAHLHPMTVSRRFRENRGFIITKASLPLVTFLQRSSQFSYRKHCRFSSWYGMGTTWISAQLAVSNPGVYRGHLPGPAVRQTNQRRSTCHDVFLSPRCKEENWNKHCYLFT